MLRIVELADGSFRFTLEMGEKPMVYREEFRFEKVEDDSEIPEKDKGYRLELKV